MNQPHYILIMNQSYISNVCYLIPLWFPMVWWFGSSLQRSDLRLKDLRELKVTSRSGFVWESTLPLYLPFLRWGPQIGEYSMIWCDMMCFDMTLHDVTLHDVIWYDMTWSDMIWTVMIWTVMNCFDILWYDIFQVCWNHQPMNDFKSWYKMKASQ